MADRVLSDLGERQIIAELLAPRYAAGTRFGDDCATVPLTGVAPDSVLVATTDPCPPPMATAIGFEDLFYTGWLLATLNLSDLAAAGAQPCGVLTSLTMPASTTVAAFERLLDGIDACCAHAGTRVIGGNLKEAPRLDLSATAIGTCPSAELVTRTGGRAGDRIMVIGDVGTFWAGTLAYRAGLIAPGQADHPLLRNVLTPSPKVRVMRQLAASGLLSCAMDNSDGLYPSLEQLATANGVGVMLDGDGICFGDAVQEVAGQLEIDPLRLSLGWGDWHIVACCAPTAVDDVAAIARRHGTAAQPIGELTADAGVILSYRGKRGKLLALDSQRFTAGSWFSSGLDGYIEALLGEPLLQPSDDS